MFAPTGVSRLVSPGRASVLYYCAHASHHLEDVFHNIFILCSNSCIHYIWRSLLLVVDGGRGACYDNPPYLCLPASI
eukprot:12643267-Ditylum_brightwellii.AAC.1